jgi:cbb3-type cytochrome oxidase subunit 3
MENNFSDLPLADIHLPEAPGYWPLAPGWWILIGLIIILCLVAFIWYRRKKREAYRQQALIEFQQIEREFLQDRNSAKFLQATSLLLKRTALTAWQNQFNASISGVDWLHWLDEQQPKRKQSFNSELGQALIMGQYQKAPVIQLDLLKPLIIDWIKQHQNQWQKKSPATKILKEQKDV